MVERVAEQRRPGRPYQTLAQAAAAPGERLRAAVDELRAQRRVAPPRAALVFDVQVACSLLTFVVLGVAFVNALSISPRVGEKGRSELCSEDAEAFSNTTRMLSFAAIFFAGALLNFKEFLSMPLF